MIIAIDGPTASGKSTLAKQLARTLGMQYINTGLLFRAVGWLLVHRCAYKVENLDVVNADDFERCVDPEILRYEYSPDTSARVSWGLEDITPELKKPAMDTAASILGINPMVRDYLLDYIRCLAADKDTVAEGRDMGTVVFPDATNKLYVVASLPERARRWRNMQKNRGRLFTQKEAEEKISTRDIRDSSRTIAPLRQAADAVLIDSTDLSVDQTLQRALAIIKEKA